MSTIEKIQDKLEKELGRMPTQAEMISALTVTVDNLKRKNGAVKTNELSLRVSEKGAVSVYGLGRFPVTLYSSQWLKLNESMGKLMDFIQDNKASLATKDEQGVQVKPETVASELPQGAIEQVLS